MPEAGTDDLTEDTGTGAGHSGRRRRAPGWLDAAWLDRKRLVRVMALAALFNLLMAGWAVLENYQPAVLLKSGGVPDFSAFWAAGRLALDGTPELAYDLEAHRAVQRIAMSADFTTWMMWHYPPSVQMLFVPVGALPIWPAMAVWVGFTLGLLAWVGWRIVPGWPTVLACLAVGPTMMLYVNGQVGALVAALVGLALLDRDRHPARPGVWLGLLSIKPHLALALPVFFLATGRWRVVAMATLTVLAMVALSAVLLGPGAWVAFVHGAGELRELVTNADWRFEMQTSLYAVLRLAGLPLVPAMAVQAVLVLAVLGTAVSAWRAPDVPPDIKAALVCFATVLITPRVFTYDLHILLVGALFQVRHARAAGFFPGEKLILLATAFGLLISIRNPPLFNPAVVPVLYLACLLGHARPTWAHAAAARLRGRRWVGRG